MNKFKIICLSLVVLILYNLVSAFETISNISTSATVGLTVLIDAGHGGEDGGAVGVGGVNEKDLNLEITLKLKEIFEENGYNVILTRDSDVDLSDDTLSTVSERKTSDMQARLEIINSSDADIVLSIHQNYFEQSQYSGAQIFYANENSQTLAETLQANIVQFLQPDNTRLAKQVDDKYLLNNSNKPMVIVECGFISNEEETANLLTEEYQNELSQVIFTAVNSYLM